MRKNKAQSTLEYAVLIIVVAAALFAMQAYFKRGVQGKMRDTADNIGGGAMYSPGATYSGSLTTRSINETGKSYTETTSTEEKNISENTFELNQEKNQTETVPSFAVEPRRE